MNNGDKGDDRPQAEDAAAAEWLFDVSPIRFYADAFRRYIEASRLGPATPDAVFPPSDAFRRFTAALHPELDAGDRHARALRACSGFAAMALNAAESGKLGHAWPCAAMSLYWLGVLAADGTATIDPTSRKMILQDFAQLASDARHAPSRDARRLVIEWWNEKGKDRMTKEAAADAIVKARLVHEARSTIRGWLRGA